MKKKVILLVEDNPDDAELTLRSLKKNNIDNEVVVARDGMEALEYVFATGAYANRSAKLTPAVILLDLKLPKLDGFEVLRRLRADERTKLIPVIVVTGSGDEQDMATSYSLGANSYVRKPVDSIQFSEAVKQLRAVLDLLNQPRAVWVESRDKKPASRS